MKAAWTLSRINLVANMDNLRFVLFVFFVFLSYMLWEQWQVDYGPKPTVTQSSNPTVGSQRPGEAATLPNSNSPAIATTPASTGSEQVELGQRVTIRTDVLHAEIDSQGGDLRILDLSTYPLNKDQPDIPVRLLNDMPEAFFIAQSGFIAEGESAPNHHSRWLAEGIEYQLAEGADVLRVPFTWDNGRGVKVVKTYVFHKGSYLVEMEQLVMNLGNTPWKGRQYVQLQRKEPEKKAGSAFSTSSADRAFVGGVLYTPQDKYEKISFSDMAETNLKREAADGWVAMIQHYFAVAWIPQKGEETSFYSKFLGDHLFIIGGTSPASEIKTGSQEVFKARIYAGPKLQRTLESIAPGLELTVDYGNLTFIAKPIFWLLEQFHKIFNNWGWAIIFGTIVIKLVFYKLSESSYRSMANMRKLQPKLKELKERYGEDKQQFNVAMMDLYRKEKVNPLGGCLPILVQIPVFISLYWVLIESVEMRQAPFLLWLTDLSSKDPYFILPAIMGVSMFIQQKLNPAPVDPIQAKVMQYFPVMFTVFFAFFPSGLVLYWVVNNLLSILQQWYITRQIAKTA
jgi:YidC/Oxa1 family membrane protein insertase